MIRNKLVELEGEFGYPKEVDVVKIDRVARDFRRWLLSLNPSNDPYGFLSQDLPLVESVLNGELPLPYRGPEPHSWEIREGLLPRDYTKASAPFYNAIRGVQLCEPVRVVREADRFFGWCQFEESSSGDGE